MTATPLVFPSGAAQGAPNDFIKFEFFKYEAPYSSAITGGIGGQGAAYNNSAESLSSAGLNVIYLPMPTDVGSKYGGKWAGQDLTTVMSGILTALGKAGKGIGENTQAATGNTGVDNAIQNALKSTGGFAGEQLYRYAANKIGEVPGLGSNLTANDLLALGTGSIINPNTELLYGGSSLRTHGYSFKLIPQESADSTVIKDIVNTFRKAILPKRNSGDTSSAFGFAQSTNFIGIPDVCKVSFLTWTNARDDKGENKFLPKYKTSAITALDVSYVTDGQYQTFEDGAPIGIQLTVAFTELKLLFKEDLDTYR